MDVFSKEKYPVLKQTLVIIIVLSRKIKVQCTAILTIVNK